MPDQEGKEKTIFHGLVVPIEWDFAGTVVAAGLSTFDEQEYILSHPKGLETWLRLMHREVRLEGKILEDPKGSKTIQVSAIQLASDGAPRTEVNKHMVEQDAELCMRGGRNA